MIKTITTLHRFYKPTSRPADVPETYRLLNDPLVQIVIPVLNEAAILRQSITRLDTFLQMNLPYRYSITIADNGSSDGTRTIASELATQLTAVEAIHIPQAGRGRALKMAWQASQADVVSYMDVDLSTNLDDFLPMITPLVQGAAGIGIGTRLHRQSQTTRGTKRELISRGYNRIIKLSAKTSFSDAQCGFKAMRRDVMKNLLPRVKDTAWFFDTELLIKAEAAGIPVHEQPVRWVEDTDSRVNIMQTAIADLKGLHRVNNELAITQLYQRLFLPFILLSTAGLYLFGALQNGMANSYYSAAVQAASQNWTAWLFGSLDAANYISIDKPPLATMMMGLSARLFGFSSFSMLLPEVLAGVGTIWLVYACVKRQFGFSSAAIAAIVMAVTPVAALMFGFNNPDALLTVLLAASGYTFLRALEQRRPLMWLSLSGLFTGLAFNTKMLQGLMVMPAIGLVYLVFAKPTILKRISHMVGFSLVTTAATLWWPVLVWLTPAANRPWVGSTSDNSIWSLIFGYNGFGRLLGSGMGGGGGMGGSMAGTGFGGSTGILRIFNASFGPNIAWLLILAITGGGIMLWILRKTPRSHPARASVVFWLVWLIVHIIIFSMTGGVIHPYYVVVMAPAVAALTGISLPFLWGAYTRRKPYAIALPIAVAATTAVATILIGYSDTYGWLGWVIASVGGLATICLTAGLYVEATMIRTIGSVAGIIACLAGPFTYTMATVQAVHTGSIPTAGPLATAMAGSNNESAIADSALVTYLLEHQGEATWIVAVASANESAAIQLTSGQPVMAVGGFNGSDSALTLDEFKQLVADGRLKYYAVSAGRGGMGGGPGGGTNDISSWVANNGTKVTYGGSDVTLYQL